MEWVSDMPREEIIIQKCHKCDIFQYVDLVLGKWRKNGQIIKRGEK